MVRQGLNHSLPAVRVPDAGLDSVGDHEHLVHGKQGGQFRFVGLELLPGRPEGGVFIRRVLELDDAQRQAVDEQHHVGSAVVLILGDGELVDRQPVVAGGFVEVDDLHLRPANGAFGRPVLHRHTLHQHAVEGAVSGLQRGSLRADQLAKGILQRGRPAGAGSISARASRSRCASTTSP